MLSSLTNAYNLNPNEGLFSLAYALACNGNSEDSKRYAQMGHDLAQRIRFWEDFITYPWLCAFLWKTIKIIFFLGPKRP